MALKNDYLIRARKNKNDEFYTQYKDIEQEVMKFQNYFKNKIVYCPCDNQNSQFRKFFIDNYDKLELDGLYSSAIDGNTIYYNGHGFAYLESNNIDITGEEYLSILQKCDIVVTNPPFSLFVGFLDTIVENHKDFLIVGQQNTITCKSVFEKIMNKQVHIDYGFKGIAGWFKTPDEYVDFANSGDHKEGLIRVSGVIWYTSFDCEKENKFIDLKCSYYNEDGTPNREKYPVYDNFRSISGLDEDCININKVKDIPYDYFGYMGVPISFFGKYNPNQFELIQLDHYGPLGNQDNMINGKMVYRRIYIKLRKNNE